MTRTIISCAGYRIKREIRKEKNKHNGMQKPEEIISGPDFICDPVPYEYRKYYERRKGRHHVGPGIFAGSNDLRRGDPE